MQENNAFEYTYTALTEAERKRAQSIRERYQTQEQSSATDKVARLQELDKKVKYPPMVLAWIMGVVGTLIFGGGLALVLELDMFLWGVILAAVGIIPVALAYPVYRLIHEKRKAKYREEILRLSNEILEEK